MTITRIETLVFGVADVGACARFHADAGLEVVQQGDRDALLRTPAGQTLILRPMDDPALPPALEAGPTLRELRWGVDGRAALDRIADDLARDRPVSVDADGVVHSRDETGLGIGFVLSNPATLPEHPPRTYNTADSVARWNDPVIPYKRPRPLRIAHLAYNIPKEGHDAAVDFYLSRLGFKATDRILDTGTFMQCAGDVEHHNFFLCHRPDAAGFNHFALDVRDFDELVEAGNYMIERRWDESRVMGRHLLGSNLYRFFFSPAGGRLEFINDMDKLDKDFETRVWERNPGHHLWSLKSSGQPAA
ncbi:MAG: VOC family protein [Azospirillaceae bacterium]|nr:VOC family protein [Azospirillaceae bacterium]